MLRIMMTSCILAASLFMLSGCFIIPVYKPDIQQGNVYAPEILAQIKPGMSEAQVKYILGSPVLINTFNINRWDYVYTFQTGNHPRTVKSATITFNQGRVVNIS